MKILALDPGISTGYALLSPEGDLLECGTLQPEDLPESLLVKFIGDPGVTVIIEDTPIPTQGKMNQRLQSVKTWVESSFPSAIKVLPGVWKTNLSIANYPLPQKWRQEELTPHQKDAFRLGIWYIVYQQEVK